MFRHAKCGTDMGYAAICGIDMGMQQCAHHNTPGTNAGLWCYHLFAYDNPDGTDDAVVLSPVQVAL
eukprot:2244017-Rhodomonas_salina.1